MNLRISILILIEKGLFSIQSINPHYTYIFFKDIYFLYNLENTITYRFIDRIYDSHYIAKLFSIFFKQCRF